MANVTGTGGGRRPERVRSRTKLHVHHRADSCADHFTTADIAPPPSCRLPCCRRSLFAETGNMQPCRRDACPAPLAWPSPSRVSTPVLAPLPANYTPLAVTGAPLAGRGEP